METKGFEIIINVSVRFFRFNWIPMLWVYDHYKYFNSFSAGTVFMRLNLTTTDTRLWRIKTVPALKGLWKYVMMKIRVIQRLVSCNNLLRATKLLTINSTNQNNTYTHAGMILGQRRRLWTMSCQHWVNLSTIPWSDRRCRSGWLVI